MKREGESLRSEGKQGAARPPDWPRVARPSPQTGGHKSARRKRAETAREGEEKGGGGRQQRGFRV